MLVWGFQTRGCGWRPAATCLIQAASAPSVELKGSGALGLFIREAGLPGAGPGLWPKQGKEKRLSCKTIVGK